MKKTRLNRALSLVLALVLCAGMVPATAIPVAAAESAPAGMAVISTDDFSAYEVGEDTFYQNSNYTGFYEAYHNAAGSESYATYGIAMDGSNKVLSLTSVNETPNYFHTGTTFSGERSVTMDINFRPGGGASVPGLVFNPLEGQTFANGGVLVYIEAQGDVKFRGDLNGNLEQILVADTDGAPLRMGFDTWYTVKTTVTKGQMVLKAWLKGSPEPADNATVGVAVYRSDKIDDGIIAGQSQLRIMTRNRNRPGEAYTVWLDNLTLSAAVQLKLTDTVIGMGGGRLTPELVGAKLAAPVYAWTSSDPDVVKVDALGNLAALKAGKATVTASLLDAQGAVITTASCEVTVDATSIDTAALAQHYNTGDTVQLKLTQTVPNVTWTSSDLSVATVDASGTVTCKSRGLTKITASWLQNGVPSSDAFVLQVGEAVKSLKLLVIGGTYDLDNTFYLKKLDQLYPDVSFDFSVLHGGDISVQGHARNAIANAAAYTLYTPDGNGNLVKNRENVRISEMLSGEDWDVVMVGSHNYVAGHESAYRTDMKYMLDYLRDVEPGAKLWWPMAWSYADGYDPYNVGTAINMGYSDYLKNSAWMYNAIIRCTNRYILGRTDWFDNAVPVGVAVQNLRAALGRDLTRDSDHLTNKTGRLAAGVTLFNSLCLELGYTPDLSLLTADRVNFLVDGESQYPDKDYKATDLPKIAQAVTAAFADMADRKLTELNVPDHPENTQTPGAITVDQTDPPSVLRFPDIKKLPDGRLVAAYSDTPVHSIDKTKPIIGIYSVRFAMSEDNGKTWTSTELYDLEKAALKMNGPGMETLYSRYELLKQNPSATYSLGGITGDSDLLPVKMDLNNDGKAEDALLYTGTLFSVYSNASHTRDVVMTWIAVDDLDDWIAGKPGVDWSPFQTISSTNKRGDAVQFDDGSMLLPTYTGGRVIVYDMTFNPKTQQWEWDLLDDVRDVPNLAPVGDWTSSNDAFNEFSMISPDGTDKVVYGMVRSSGVVYATYDRGRNWELVGNEPGSAQQPQFAYIDTNRAFVTWSDEDSPRSTMGKVFYYDAGWDETETRLIYASPLREKQDAADPSCAYLDDGTVMTIQYDQAYLSIVGVKDDPNSEEFLPNTLTTKDLATAASADSVQLGGWASPTRPEGSFIMEFNLTLNSDSTVVQALMRADVGVKLSTKGVTCLDDTCVQNMTLTAGTKYSVKVAAIGKMLWGKVWPAGSAEPAWSVWCTDHANKSMITAATLHAPSGSATVEKIAVKIPAMFDLAVNSVSGTTGDGGYTVAYDRYNTKGTIVWSSSDPTVAPVDQEGVIRFLNPGVATITAKLGTITRTVEVSVRPAPAELTGAGEKKVMQTEDFSSYPVGNNAFYAFLGKDKAFSTTPPGTEPGQGYSILEENGNKFLQFYDDGNMLSPWIMSNTTVTGNYTVQFDYRNYEMGANSLYVTMFQKNSDGAVHPNTAMFRLQGTTGIQINGGEWQSAIPNQQWATFKLTCVNGALYAKVWPKSQPEPVEWSAIAQVPGLSTATPNHLRLQAYSSGTLSNNYGNQIDIDNIIITQQQVTGAAAMLDVIPGTWYYDAVDYVINNKIMSGYNAETFGANDTLNRAMVVQVLYNKEGQPALNGLKHSFSDVPASQWYNNAVTWGSNRGVVSGYGGGVFKPEDAVTIEQVAVILHNYSGKPAGNGDLSKVGNHSDWAADALKWAVGEGILDNVPFTNATEKATRAQTAQMLTNYLRGN
ncbi:MAG: DUF4886 domain-containing protein [Ruminococcaceae bacterium]|nr:DUF4886 domain-containing protein [Oscillospiraceae bacterium]